VTEVVPRWEWRTFGDDLGDAETRLRATASEGTRESDEVYLVSLESNASVKVRDGLMDVKELQVVDDDGLEQWKPVLKAEFPLAADDVRSVLAALGVDTPALGRSAYSLDELLDEVVEPAAELRAVDVHKRREHHTVAGCRAELSEFRVGGRVRGTIAVESEEPGRVTAAVRELGLGSRPNVCVARGLKALVGFGARRYAVVDVGTNSVKFHVGELAADGAWGTISDRAEITRLGEGLDETGRLGAQPIERTVDAIAGMVDEARQSGVEAIAAVGTAGLRIAPNRAELVDAVRERTGVVLVVFDTGGGSSQFTFGRGNQVDERFSVDVGAARFTERYGLDGAVSETTLAAALDAIAGDLGRLDGRPSPETLVGMGGAVTNLAAVEHGLTSYDPDIVQGTILAQEEVDRQIELYRTRTADERRRIAGLQPKRAEVILAGACIVRTVLAKLGAASLAVSDRGLRHGLLVERFSSR
jgi:exopolyphosphatase/guanosine-5'-triphosphate,3'-diphosphate pyrophosphatase